MDDQLVPIEVLGEASHIKEARLEPSYISLPRLFPLDLSYLSGSAAHGT